MMRSFFLFFLAAAIVIIGTGLSGCATAARGAHTEFKILSSQENVSVLLDLETPKSRKTFGWRDRRDALKKTGPEPDFEFHACESLPCNLTIPRKHTFSVLAYKAGYKPQIFEIAHIHKTEYDKLTQASAAAGAAATVTGVGVVASSFPIYGSGSMAAATTGAGLFMAGVPIMVFFLGASEVDKDNMANYDFFPNPLTINLAPLGDAEPEFDIQTVISEYQKQRVKYALDPQKSGLCYIGDTRISCRRLKRMEENLRRLEKYDIDKGLK